LLDSAGLWSAKETTMASSKEFPFQNAIVKTPTSFLVYFLLPYLSVLDFQLILFFPWSNLTFLNKNRAVGCFTMIILGQETSKTTVIS
jgi:hypothetical protein